MKIIITVITSCVQFFKDKTICLKYNFNSEVVGYIIKIKWHVCSEYMVLTSYKTSINHSKIFIPL